MVSSSWAAVFMRTPFVKATARRDLSLSLSILCLTPGVPPLPLSPAARRVAVPPLAGDAAGS
eukprot:8398190-Pyramimonas_sp.AAC.1